MTHWLCYNDGFKPYRRPPGTRSTARTGRLYDECRRKSSDCHRWRHRRRPGHGMELARRGCAVLVNYSRSRSEAEQTAADITALGVRGVAIEADVADDTACRGMVDTAVREFGRLDVLVNNAGTTRFIPHDQLEEVSEADWDRILSVNLRGPFQCSRAAAAAIRAGGGEGEIVNVASVAGIAATGSSIPYCAVEGWPDQHDDCPGPGARPRFASMPWPRDSLTAAGCGTGIGPAYDAVMKTFEERLPLGRVCQPEDVAAAILSLITGSDMVTGQTIVCDSGMLITDFSARARARA